MASPSCMIVQTTFLVKYCVRYLGIRLFKQLKTRMHLCIFLLEGRFKVFRYSFSEAIPIYFKSP